MATTTTNFGWDIPQSTDLVKDGATAIAALGQDIDTAFVDFKGGTTGQVLKKTSGTDLDVEWGTPSSGLTLINTTSFSGVLSQSVNDVFSATYNNYRIVCHINNTSAADGMNLRLRVSGADNTTSNYNLARVESNASAVVNRYSAGTTSFDINSTDDGGAALGFVIDLQAPFASNRTVGQMIVMGQSSDANYSARFGGYVFSATTSFTGYTIFVGSGTMTGSISTFAYNA
jgi:hypothetical protein